MPRFKDERRRTKGRGVAEGEKGEEARRLGKKAGERKCGQQKDVFAPEVLRYWGES